MPALTVDKRRVIIVSSATFFFFLFLFLLTAGPDTQAKSKIPIAELAYTDKTLYTHPCDSDYLQIAHDLASSAHSPILDERQLVEISTIIRTSAYARNGRANNVLVYGLGHDSSIWRAANCVPSSKHSKTLFLEDSKDWINDIVKTYPYLQAEFITYDTLLPNLDADLRDRTRMTEAPQSVTERCWDVTLIDAPLGFDQHKHPGRVAPSWWTLKNAGECLNSGKRDVVYVFLHDVERSGEQKIRNTIFDNRAHVLGVTKQYRGDLVAYAITRDTLAGRK